MLAAVHVTALADACARHAAAVARGCQYMSKSLPSEYQAHARRSLSYDLCRLPSFLSLCIYIYLCVLTDDLVLQGWISKSKLEWTTRTALLPYN